MSFKCFIISCLVVCLSLTAIGGYFSLAVADDDVTFPICDLSDSVAVVAATTGLRSLMHPFGTPGYAHEFSLATSYPVFNSVFELYLTDTVSSRWTSTDFHTLIGSVLDNDSTLTDDIFGKVWYYFAREDADGNAYHAGVRFTTPYGALIDTVYTRIVIQLYAREDIPGYPSTCNSSTYGDACKGYSITDENVITINASPANSMEDVLKLGIGHELAHVCWNANGLYALNGYNSAGETMSTLAEYIVDGWRPGIYDYPYDSSFFRGEQCDQDSKYNTEKSWITYVYDVTRGNPSDPTDDLVYRWINSATSAPNRMLMPELATQLWDSDFSWIGGSNATDRVNRLFGDFLVAKFANAPDFGSNSRFGAEGVNSFLDLHFFQDNCNYYAPGATPMSPVDCPSSGYPAGHVGCWNVRVIPPSWELTDDHENHLTSITGTYTDREDTPSPSDGDGSTDYVDVATYGTDYVVFRAGEYYNDSAEHEFRLVVSGAPQYKHPPYSTALEIQPVGWILGYSSASDTLEMHPESLVFVEPLTFTPSTTTGDSVVTREVRVTDFGRGIKSVVLAIACTSQNFSLLTFPLNYLDYTYRFGVYTPAASASTWKGDVYVCGDVTVPDGGTLTVEPGTHVKILNTDLGIAGDDTTKIEINVDGELVADGSLAAPITFLSWKPTGFADWAGFNFHIGSDGGTFDHCRINRAANGITSYVPLTLTDSQVDSCQSSGVYLHDGGGLIQGCGFQNMENYGVYVAADTAVVRNTLVDNAGVTGIHLVSGASLVLRNSTVTGDTGLYVGGSGFVDADSSVDFSGSNIGVHFYNSGSNDILKKGQFEGYGDIAVFCDNSASPAIDSCYAVDGGDAIYCSNSSSPTITDNYIKRVANGVVTESSANPDIGHYSTTGNNSISHVSGKYVKNLNSTGTIYAQNNCWNVNTGSCAPSSSFFQGSVDKTHPQCCSIPRDDMTYTLPQPDSKRVVTGIVNVVPNPFNPTTTISYALAAQSKVNLSIYDVAGRLVNRLVDETQVAGIHSIVWRGTDRRGTTVASGVYFVRMQSAGQSFTRKMVMLK